MTKVFSIRISDSLFDKITKEIKETGLNRKTFFQKLIDLYYSQKTLKKESIHSVYSQKNGYDINTIHKQINSLKSSKINSDKVEEVNR